MNELIQNIDKIHSTPMGVGRIARNLGIPESAVMDTCRDIIQRGRVTGRGKNYYVTDGKTTLCIHARAMTIITAHKN